ncbi:MAG: HAD family hydrolase [Lachnospiraceae bacterium]
MEDGKAQLYKINCNYTFIYDEALKYYKQNKKGDIELGKKYHLPKRKEHIEDEILYKDVPYCLEILNKKYRIGVIANQSLGTKSRLEKWGIMKYIDLVIASAEEGVSKPNPKIFEIALQRAKCEANKAIMIGDRIDNDIMPAKKMGMRTIWIKQGFGGYWQITGDDEKPDYIVENMIELCSCL